MAGVIGDATLPIFLTNSFLTPDQLTLATITLGVVLGIPIIVLIYRISRSLFKIKEESRIFNYTAGIIWIVGVLITFWIGFDLARQFKVTDTHRVEIPIAQPTTDTIHLAMLNPYEDRNDIYYNGKWKIMSNGWSINTTEDTILIEDVEVDIQRADGNEFELYKIITSKGPNRKEAEKNSRGIKYEIVQDDSVLRFSRDYMLPKTTFYRAQKIRMILKVPVGKSVFLGENIEDVIYDIKNVTNTWDNDMVGHTWTMTNRGLECINCHFEERNTDSDDEDVHIRVNGQEVDINSDKDTIDWDNKDVKIRIDDKGVIIDAKEKK